jgi:hypothetical protein
MSKSSKMIQTRVGSREKYLAYDLRHTLFTDNARVIWGRSPDNRLHRGAVSANRHRKDWYLALPWAFNRHNSRFSWWNKQEHALRVKRRVVSRQGDSSYIAATDLHIEWRNHTSYARRPTIRRYST